MVVGRYIDVKDSYKDQLGSAFLYLHEATHYCKLNQAIKEFSTSNRHLFAAKQA